MRMKHGKAIWTSIVIVLIMVAGVFAHRGDYDDIVGNTSNWKSSTITIDSASTLAVACTSTFTDDVAITGNLTVSGTISPTPAVVVEATTAYSVLASESGTTFVNTGSAGATTFSLPTAVAGLIYTFVDNSVTAADDLFIAAAAGDTINAGTAEKNYECTTDAVKQAVTIQALNDTEWEVISEVGTWANNNS